MKICTIVLLYCAGSYLDDLFIFIAPLVKFNMINVLKYPSFSRAIALAV